MVVAVRAAEATAGAMEVGMGEAVREQQCQLAVL